MQAPLELHSRCRLSGDVRFRVVGDEGIVLRQNDAEILVLNAVGARIVELIDSRRTIAAIIDQLAAEYAAEPAQLQRDVFDYLAELRQNQVVEADD